MGGQGRAGGQRGVCPRRCPHTRRTQLRFKGFIYPHTSSSVRNVELAYPNQIYKPPRLPVRAAAGAREPAHLAAPVVLDEAHVPVIVFPILFNFGRTMEHLGGWLHDVFRREPALHAAAKLVVSTPHGLAMPGCAHGVGVGAMEVGGASWAAATRCRRPRSPCPLAAAGTCATCCSHWWRPQCRRCQRRAAPTHLCDQEGCMHGVICPRSFPA